MLDLNPYQPPKSDVRNYENKSGYREGDNLVVKQGYDSPKVCYFTGSDDEGDLEPMKVTMRGELSWSFYTYLGFIILAVALVEWQQIGWWTVLVIVSAIWFSGFVYSKFLPSFTIYCASKLNRVFLIKNGLGNLLSAAGLTILLMVDDEFYLEHMLLGMVLIIGSIPLLKKPLKSAGIQGGYDQYKGAHTRFLEALPERERDTN